MRLSIAVLCAALAAAAPAAAQMTAPPTLAGLCQAFAQEIDNAKQVKLLGEIARTPPVEPRDVLAAVDLFNRYSDERVRAAVVSAFELTSVQAQQLEPAFTSLLSDNEPSNILLGIKGSLRLRSASAHPLIEKLAKQKFKLADPDAPGTLPSERDKWWAHYEALYALGVWDGDKALPLILKKTKQAPRTGRILGLLFWKQTLPQLARWAGGHERDRQRAQAALQAPAPIADLRATRAQMLALIEDPKADPEVRHQLALKVGLSSTRDEAAALVARYDQTKDDQLKLYLAAAIFATRSKAAIPLLLRFAKQAPDPLNRAGARVELKELLSAKDYRDLVEWAAKNDPDGGNRLDAEKELKTLPPAK